MNTIFSENNINNWDDLMGIEILKKIFINMCEKKDIPNLIIHGNTGSGKSIVTKMLLKHLYGNINNYDGIMKLTVNDERGISAVRDKIKTFSSNQVSYRENTVQFKIILFDQANSLTIDAQNALRRIIETSSKLTRFIFLTSCINSIIDPIKSRCLILKIPIINKKIKLDYYKKLILKHDIKIKTTDISKIIDNCSGDIRKEKATIDVLYRLQNSKNNKKLINEYVFNEFDEKYFLDFYENFKLIKKVEELNDLLKNNLQIYNQKDNFVKKFYENFLKDSEISDNLKIKFIQLAYCYNKNLSYGSDTYICTLNFFTQTYSLLQD